MMLIIFTSCYTDFEPDIESSPVVCLNSVAHAGDTLRVNVTRTWRWSEGLPDETIDIYIPDATVDITVNGDKLPQPRYVRLPYTDYYRPDPGYTYMTDYVVRPGDEIKIHASTSKYGDAYGETNVPEGIKIDKCETILNKRKVERRGNSTIYSGDATVLLYFTDPADEVNYYMLSTMMNFRPGPDNRYLHTTLSYNYDNEPLFAEQITPLDEDANGYTIFTDRQISGKTYALHMVLEDISYEITNDDPSTNPSYVEFSLDELSETYYKHVLSVWTANDGLSGTLGGIGLGDHVWELSNVSTGAGVIVSSSSGKWKLPLCEIFGITRPM